MMMKRENRLSFVKYGIMACAVLMTVSAAKAGDTDRSTRNAASVSDRDVKVAPVMFSLCSPAEIPWWQPAWDVSGIRFCVPYGSCRNMSGLDVGVVTHASSFYGIQCSAVNVVVYEVRIYLYVC